MCSHVSALRAFELQLVQKPVVITTGRGCASPFGLKLKSGPGYLTGIEQPTASVFGTLTFSPESISVSAARKSSRVADTRFLPKP
jgi:hypothetical protein